MLFFLFFFHFFFFFFFFIFFFISISISSSPNPYSTHAISLSSTSARTRRGASGGPPTSGTPCSSLAASTSFLCATRSSSSPPSSLPSAILLDGRSALEPGSLPIAEQFPFSLPSLHLPAASLSPLPADRILTLQELTQNLCRPARQALLRCCDEIFDWVMNGHCHTRTPSALAFHTFIA